MAGGPGFEPRLTESESAVLPLNYPPTAARTRVFLRGRGASIAKRGGGRKRLGTVSAPFHARRRSRERPEDVARGRAPQTCSTATTPGAALSAPAIAALTE
jgi:hypothetical protein